jgi:hypothetical protein
MASFSNPTILPSVSLVDITYDVHLNLRNFSGFFFYWFNLLLGFNQIILAEDYQIYSSNAFNRFFNYFIPYTETWKSVRQPNDTIKLVINRYLFGIVLDGIVYETGVSKDNGQSFDVTSHILYDLFKTTWVLIQIK